MSWIKVIEDIFKTIFCTIFPQSDACWRNPFTIDPQKPTPTFPSLAPSTTAYPGASTITTTTEKPDSFDPEPIWNGNKTFADCLVLDSGLFKDWCDAFDPSSNRSGVPRLYADMLCQNRTDCAYRFWFTQEWDLRYKRSCSDGTLVGMIIQLNDTGRAIIKQKCDESPSGIPLYALVLIFLGVLAVLITIATFAWNRGESAKEAVQSQMSRMPTNRSAAYSNIGTMRSKLPTTRSHASLLPSKVQTPQRSLSRSKRSNANPQSSQAGNSARMSSALSGSRSSQTKVLSHQ